MENYHPYEFGGSTGCMNMPDGEGRWLVGLMTCDMSGHTHPVIKRPFLIVEGESSAQAEEIYYNRVPLATYYASHAVASWKDGKWILCTDFMSPSAMETLLRELMSDPKRFSELEDNR